MKKAAALVLILLSIIPLVVNLIRWENVCFNGVDFGAYHASMVATSFPNELNPINPVNGIGMQSDHFEVGLWLMAPFVHWAGNTGAASVVYEWLTWILGLMVLLILNRRQKFENLLWIGFFYICAKGFITALEYPIHPSFWSVSLWVLFVWSFFRQKNIICLISIFAICLFKESYCLSFVPLALFLLVDKQQRKFGLYLLGLLSVCILWNFKIRAMVFGPTSPFASRMLRDLFENPLDASIERIKLFPYRDFIEIYLGIILLFVISFRANARKTTAILFSLLPLIGIHLWTALIGRQYAFVFAITSLSTAIFSGALFETVKSKKWKYALIFSAIFPGMILILHPLELFVRDNDDSCTISSEHRNEFHQLQEKFSLIPKGKKIGVTGDVLPNLYRTDQSFFQLLAKSPIQESYDYLVLHRADFSDTYPLTKAQVKTVIQSCEPFLEERILETKSFVFWKGNFPWQCIYQWPSEAVNRSQFGL